MSEEACYRHKSYSLKPELDREVEGFVHKMLYVFLALALLEPFVFSALASLVSCQ